MKRRIHHIDLNHSWLEVPKSDLGLLGLDDGLFAYVRESGESLYLSEDEEMDVYLDAAEAAGWVVTLNPRHYDRCTTIRNLPMPGPSAEEAMCGRFLGSGLTEK